MNKRLISLLMILFVLMPVFACSPVKAALPPTPAVYISSPSNTTITLGQSFAISGRGTNCHHICGFVNGSPQVTQSGNSYSVSYRPTSTGVYYVCIKGRNTANSTDPGTKLVTSSIRKVTVVKPTGTIRIFSKPGAKISGQINGMINSSGYCSYSNMAYGTYTFSVSKSGYNTSSNNSITLNSSYANRIVNLTPVQSHVVKIKVVNNANNINQTYTANGSRYSLQIYGDTLPTTISLSATNNGNSLSISPNSIYLSKSADNNDYLVKTANGSLTLSVTIVKRASKWATTYLTPVPVNGNITVTVRDKDTNAKIAGAALNCGNKSGTSGSTGVAVFAGMSFGTYNISASKSGYYSNKGSARISALDANEYITIYLTKKPTVDLSGEIQTFGDARTDTDVIFNVIVSNTGDRDFIPSDNVKVSFTVAGMTQEYLLIVPKNSSQVIPFRIHTPSVAGAITLTAFVDSTNASQEINESNNTSTKTVNVYKPVIPDIPDPKVHDEKPYGWMIPTVPPTVSDKRTTWYEWRYDTARSIFSRVQFYVDTRTNFTITPDPKIPTNKFIHWLQFWDKQ
jgi:hypothetical protein